MNTEVDLLVDLDKSIQSFKTQLDIFAEIDDNILISKKQYYSKKFTTDLERISFTKTQLMLLQSPEISQNETITLKALNNLLTTQLDQLSEFEGNFLNFYCNGYDYVPIKCHEHYLCVGFVSLIKQLLTSEQDQIHLQFNVLDNRLICKLSSSLINSHSISMTQHNMMVFDYVMKHHQINYEINFFQSLIYFEFPSQI